MVKREGGGRREEASSQRAIVLHPTSSTQPASQRRAGAFHHRYASEQSSTQPSQRGASQETSHHRRAPPQPSQQMDDDQSSPAETLSDEETNKLVAEVMRYMLFKSHQQPNVPVRRDELTQLVTKTYKQRNLTSAVISKAQMKLLATFGLEMKEFSRMRSSKAVKSANAAVDVKQYVLKSTIPEALLKRYVETPGTAAVLSLALLVVGIIKFSGGEKVPEETLFKNLQRMGIKEEELDHPVFGNIKNALDTVAKQRYVQKEKLSGSDGEGFVYELAERALEESFKIRLEEFMAQIVTRDNTSAMYSIPV